MAQAHHDSAQTDRRQLIVSGAAVVAAAALPKKAGAAASALAPATALLTATTAFLATLEPDKRKAASFAWNGPEWNGWNYFGVGGFIKPGLRLEQMSAPQKAAAWTLLSTVFSPAGIEKTKTVMLLQDILAASGNGAGQRSSERFSFAVFGVPAAAGSWGLRLEGHHLTQSISVRDGQIVSVTPSSFSAIPNRVTSGRYAGLVTLKDEETLARRLLGDLNTQRQARARLADSQIYNILSYAGRERGNTQKAGLAAAELGSAQRDLLWQLIDTYAVDYLAPPLAAAQNARVRAGDREAVHFAWYGANTPERGFGYRLIADGFVIEMASVDSEAQHLHTIYHDLGNVLGRTA